MPPLPPSPRHPAPTTLGILFPIALVCLVFGPILPSAQTAEPAPPWRLSSALQLPDWLKLAVVHQSRFENLNPQYRASYKGSDQMVAFRTSVRADLTFRRFDLAGEMLDSRQALSDAGSALDTSMVNAAELLQAFAALRFEGLFIENSRSEFRVGRQTLDLGSRRLIARNRFRNTINAYTGLLWNWNLDHGPSFETFYFLPVHRLPADFDSLLQNEAELDEEDFHLQLWGTHAHWPQRLWKATPEIYFYGLNESDSHDRPTRNRQLYTPGLRLSRNRARNAWDFDFESALQFGTTRGSTSTGDTRDLGHFAHFHHVEAGFTWDLSWTPRLGFLFDYASGDSSPSDDRSGRFDTLFGARRWEHGPTGIFGVFARSNIQSPGSQFSVRPLDHVLIGGGHRLYWLASSRDAWTTAGLRDPTGDSGNFVGHLLESFIQWDPLPGNLRLEAGGGLLVAGRFIRETSTSADPGNPLYGYLAVELRF